jgi:hypothetical protein
VLCFVDGDWPLFRPPSSFRGVRLEGTRSIRTLLMSPDRLDSTTVVHLTGIIAVGLPPR